MSRVLLENSFFYIGGLSNTKVEKKKKFTVAYVLCWAVILSCAMLCVKCVSEHISKEQLSWKESDKYIL